MVDVVQCNAKLQVRAENIVMEATGVDREKARETINAAGGKVKLAIVMLLTGREAPAAEALLEHSGGHIREAIDAQN